MSKATDVITTSLWQEDANPENPFIPDQCLCAGFDVYGDVLPKANYIEYLFLLFKREQPNRTQVALLNGLSIALANPGPRDHSVQAAMSGAAGASTQASSLMAALAVGAGNLGGGREVLQAMNLWQELGCNLSAWQTQLATFVDNRSLEADVGEMADDVWLPMEHPAGFDPRSEVTGKTVQQSLNYLASLKPDGYLAWLLEHRSTLEAAAGMGLAFSGLAAAAFMDLELEPETGEMLFLLLRLPGAAAHALEQRERGWRDFPFYRDKIHVSNDPLKSGSINSSDRANNDE